MEKPCDSDSSDLNMNSTSTSIARSDLILYENTFGHIHGFQKIAYLVEYDGPIAILDIGNQFVLVQKLN